MITKILEDMVDFVPIYSSEKYYDFFDGGYLDPEYFLVKEEDIDKVNEARQTILEFFGDIEEAGIFEES